MSVSNVMIHINESLGEQARATLEDSMRKVEGVISPRFNAGKEHLLMVAFDPKVTSAAVLLEATRAAGYTAQLVGM